jgi:hypothetical protein
MHAYCFTIFFVFVRLLEPRQVLRTSTNDRHGENLWIVKNAQKESDRKPSFVSYDFVRSDSDVHLWLNVLTLNPKSSVFVSEEMCI